MPAHQCSIGHPWILDLLAKYKKNVKYKPVTAQVVEFVKMSAVSSDDSQGVAAVVHISDRKYYIRGVITREAQVILEREEEHFTLGDIKNKIIILKNYDVVFTAVEDLNSCEFSITVYHFNILPMETNSVDLLNWNYMAEQAMNASSTDLSLSEVSLTQLLNIACEEKLSTLKSIAEQCLDIDPPSNQDTTQAMTKWGEERKKNKDTNKFHIPLDLLLIPPHEEAALEQITAFSNNTDVPSDLDDAINDHHSEKEPSSPSYSTALSTQSDDYFDDVSATHSANPWNKLQPLSLTLTSSSASQEKASSSEAQQKTDEDTLDDPESGVSQSYAQHVLVPSVQGSSESHQETSPLIFSDRICSQEASVSSNSGLASSQRKINPDRTTRPSLLSSHNRASLSSITISPVMRQSSPKSGSCLSSRGRLCPIMLSDSESEPSPRKIKHLVCPKEKAKEHINKRRCYPMKGKKAKRKTLFADSDSPLSDAESPDLEYESVQKMVQKKCQSNVSVAEENTNVSNTYNEAEKSSNQNFGVKDRENLCLFINKKSKEEGTISSALNPKPCTKNKKKHSLQSIESNRSKGETAKREVAKGSTSKHLNGSKNNQEISTRRKNIQLALDFSKTKMVHYDRTPFQYTYTSPSVELCTRLDAIRMPADLCEWAKKILLEPEKRFC
ncbi:hypothetical protein XENTR_v10016600 [Xenopus tropicalis]|uniref:Uncharacterized XB5835883 n=1 Tax=Xenopus tropicalis TaxID=8364 RepID=A0A6I8SRW4_XENTR|nr:hypothetical protein XENTR_v10016600 [Xenopus tropicalis]